MSEHATLTNVVDKKIGKSFQVKDEKTVTFKNVHYVSVTSDCIKCDKRRFALQAVHVSRALAITEFGEQLQSRSSYLVV